MSQHPYLIQSFAEFTQWALYDPQIGYYRQDKQRVGKAPERDFYTSVNLSPVFGDLLIESMRMLLGTSIDPKLVTLLEIGAEPGTSAFSSHPFRAHHCIGYTSPWPGVTTPYQIRFANELLDAQAFERVRFIEGQWHLCGIEHSGNTFKEILLPNSIPAEWAARLPETAQAGYTIDMPTGAQKLLDQLAAPDWQGLMLMIDYGLRWETLCHERPEGTARGYKNHRLVRDFLKCAAGSCDITHHIAWDLLQEQLQFRGFTVAPIQSQESFFMHHARNHIAQILQREFAQRQTLQALLHPAHFGQKFQVLYAKRIENQ